MKTFIAISGNQSFCSSFLGCLGWANNVISEFPSTDTIVKIHLARQEQKKMCVIAEITSSGFREIKNGREVSIRSYRKAHCG